MKAGRKRWALLIGGGPPRSHGAKHLPVLLRRTNHSSRHATIRLSAATTNQRVNTVNLSKTARTRDFKPSIFMLPNHQHLYCSETNVAGPSAVLTRVHRNHSIQAIRL